MFKGCDMVFSWCLQSPTKHSETFSILGIVSLHLKWNGTKILSTETEIGSASKVAQPLKTYDLWK